MISSIEKTRDVRRALAMITTRRTKHWRSFAAITGGTKSVCSYMCSPVTNVY